MALLDCVEELLDLKIDYGAVGGPEFNTTVVQTGGGKDYRNINWPQHKGSWEIGDRVVTSEELDYIRDFFSRRRGRAVGFRWKDWSEYKLVAQEPILITPTEYQLAKTYGATDSEIYRVPITKPVSGTAKVYVNAVELVGGWAIDDTTGILKLDVPASGVITVDTDFHKKVRFNVDSFEIEFNAHDPATETSLYSVTQIPITEIR